ncbi:metallophosphoesterase [Nocardia sp. BMG111209]|uniref:metallophosphoesterase n=1 Tax=Nocardia sp. BMG111209 TaxID=1160137 RepID=UPI0003670AB1|nr:metallophosphoesterase [Nocardia sp. BMG111209]
MSDLTLVQISDTHLRAGGESLHGVDTAANLARILDAVRAAEARVDAIVLSGDLADDGSVAAYRRLRELVAPVAAELDAHPIYVMGNHDERNAFGAELLGIPSGELDSERPHDQVAEVRGLRVIALDSTTPGRPDGRLEPSQLRWLAAELRTPAPRGTVLVVHHPPIPSPFATSEMVKLHEVQPLADVLAGTDVRLILCGHNHVTRAATLGGIPVWAGPAAAFRIDPMPPPGRFRGFAGSGYTRVDFLGPSVVTTAVTANEAEPILNRDRREMVDLLIAAHPDLPH